MSAAKVTDITAVRAFKAALIEFESEAASALEMMQMQIHRALDWVEQERPAYWTKQIQVAFENVAQTRSQLNTCRMRTVAGKRPACIEEKQAHERAKRRLQHCQQMVRRVKDVSIKLTHESDEFRGRMASFARCVENDLPRMIALIERTASSLERYAEVTSGPDDATSAPQPIADHTERPDVAADADS